MRYLIILLLMILISTNSYAKELIFTFDKCVGVSAFTSKNVEPTVSKDGNDIIFKCTLNNKALVPCVQSANNKVLERGFYGISTNVEGITFIYGENRDTVIFANIPKGTAAMQLRVNGVDFMYSRTCSGSVIVNAQ